MESDEDSDFEDPVLSLVAHIVVTFNILESVGKETVRGAESLLGLIDNFWYASGTLECRTQCLAIGSCGKKVPSDVKVAKKRIPTYDENEKSITYLPKVLVDLDRFSDRIEADRYKELAMVCRDGPRSQESKATHLKRIEVFLSNCDYKGGTLHFRQACYNT